MWGTVLYRASSCICSTHKIVGISTVARGFHSVVQTRELVCTKIVLPQVVSRGNLKNSNFLNTPNFIVCLQVLMSEKWPMTFSHKCHT